MEFDFIWFLRNLSLVPHSGILIDYWLSRIDLKWKMEKGVFEWAFGVSHWQFNVIWL